MRQSATTSACSATRRARSSPDSDSARSCPWSLASCPRLSPRTKVSDPEQHIAAANGQFLLIDREAYFRIGGHCSREESVLEDVELASIIKRRSLDSASATRRKPSPPGCTAASAAMIEGWTKNLALLFGNALALAAWRILDCSALRPASARLVL